ncbi:MAG: Cof-type HAD-IIB family hydrolase [Acidimicrobiales bacterium]
MSVEPIRLLLSDVDGTLVTHDKVLTERAIEAVDNLRDAGVLFAITSARPPRGLAMFVKPLHLTTPLAGFNGGLTTDTNFHFLDEKTIRDDLIDPIIELLSEHDVSVWVFQGDDWYVLDAQGVRVDHEARTTLCDATVVASFSAIKTGVNKIVGVSDDTDACAAANAAMQEKFASQVLSTQSQPYFVDVTHPEASKGHVVRYLSRRYDIPTANIATIGDMYNDVSMFAVSGLSIAMGDSVDEVKRAAMEVTTSNEDEGFANAVDKYILSDLT